MSSGGKGGKGGKNSRAALPWTKLIGILLVALALRLATDPDYPVSRERLAPMQKQTRRQQPASRQSHGGSRPTTGRSFAGRLPEPLAPRAPVLRSDLTFRWQWPGTPAEWRVVVFDDSFETVVEFHVGTACSYAPSAGSLASLPRQMNGFWLVEAVQDGHKVRSVPMPLDLLD